MVARRALLLYHFRLMTGKDLAIDLGPEIVHLRAPADPERLLEAIDPVEFAKDERMPYWAELWPVSIALARRIVNGGADERAIAVAGRDILDLGCGLGLVGIAAARAGAEHVTFADYFVEAIEAARANAQRNGLARFDARCIDWREPPRDRRWDAILASDVLYERRNLTPVLGAIAALLAPGGTAYVADPDRSTAAGFEEAARARGFNIRRAPLAERMTLYVVSATS
jgi:predicted nicotinamide N-methyase